MISPCTSLLMICFHASECPGYETKGQGLVLGSTGRLWEVTPCCWPGPEWQLEAPIGPRGSKCGGSQHHSASPKTKASSLPKANAGGPKSLCTWLFWIQLFTAGGIKNSSVTTATLAAPPSLPEWNRSWGDKCCFWWVSWIPQISSQAVGKSFISPSQAQHSPSPNRSSGMLH